MNKMPMYLKMERLKSVEKPEATLIVETNGRAFRVTAEKFHGASVVAPTLDEALSRIDGEINSLWSWAKRRVVSASYTHTVVETFEVGCPLDGIESTAIFSIERGIFHAVAHSVMKEMAIRSARCLQELIDALPDDGRDLSGYGGPLRLLPSGAEIRYASGRLTGEYVRKLGVKYENAGGLTYNRLRAIAAVERIPGYMRNAARNDGGEAWTFRKVLRRYIWQDRVLARALYDAARAEWGLTADPFGFGAAGT